MSEIVINTTDQIVVTRLRPMSDLMKKKDYSNFVLAMEEDGDFERVRQSSNDEVFCMDYDCFFNVSRYKGYILIPIYREPRDVS